MVRRPLACISCILVAAVVAAGCGGGDGDGGSSPGTGVEGSPDVVRAQAHLDAVMDAQHADMAVLEEAYPEDDDDMGSVLDAFDAALRKAPGVTRVERLDAWTFDTALPCGATSDPDTAVIARGPDEAFFIGRASSGWIAGFAENADGDLGTVVSRCEDGGSTALRVAPIGDESDMHRVSALSFEDGPTELVRDLRAVMGGTPVADVTLSADWTLDDPIRCAPAGDVHVVRSVEDADVFVQGNAGDVAVAVFAEGDGGDIGVELLAPCVDGQARDFRLAARPIDEVLDEQVDSGE
jgi:hypothetical protein